MSTKNYGTLESTGANNPIPTNVIQFPQEKPYIQNKNDSAIMLLHEFLEIYYLNNNFEQANHIELFAINVSSFLSNQNKGVQI